LEAAAPVQLVAERARLFAKLKGLGLKSATLDAIRAATELGRYAEEARAHSQRKRQIKKKLASITRDPSVRRFRYKIDFFDVDELRCVHDRQPNKCVRLREEVEKYKVIVEAVYHAVNTLEPSLRVAEGRALRVQGKAALNTPQLGAALKKIVSARKGRVHRLLERAEKIKTSLRKKGIEPPFDLAGFCTSVGSEPSNLAPIRPGKPNKVVADFLLREVGERLHEKLGNLKEAAATVHDIMTFCSPPLPKPVLNDSLLREWFKTQDQDRSRVAKRKREEKRLLAMPSFKRWIASAKPVSFRLEGKIRKI
jgi:hypothetical protein